MNSFSMARLVPWISWKEWEQVYHWLLGGEAADVQQGLNRVAAWRSRGRVPVAVEITAELLTLHLHDGAIMPFGAVVFPDEVLRSSYSMAIMRLVNGVVDQSQKGRYAQSMAELADAARMPRLFVDIRHEAAHNELPALSLLRTASKQALVWLQQNYWEAQQLALADSHLALRQALETLLLLQDGDIKPATGTHCTGDDPSGDHRGAEGGAGQADEEEGGEVLRGEVAGHRGEGEVNEAEEMRGLSKKEKRKRRASRTAAKKQEAAAVKELLDLVASSPVEAAGILLEEGLLLSRDSHGDDVLMDPRGSVHTKFPREGLQRPERPDEGLREMGMGTSGRVHRGQSSADWGDTVQRSALQTICDHATHLPPILLMGIIQRLAIGKEAAGRERKGADGEGIYYGRWNSVEYQRVAAWGRRQQVNHGADVQSNGGLLPGDDQGEGLASVQARQLANCAVWLLEEEARRWQKTGSREDAQRESGGSPLERNTIRQAGESSLSGEEQSTKGRLSQEVIREGLCLCLSHAAGGGPIVDVALGLVRLLKVEAPLRQQLASLLQLAGKRENATAGWNGQASAAANEDDGKGKHGANADGEKQGLCGEQVRDVEVEGDHQDSSPQDAGGQTKGMNRDPREDGGAVERKAGTSPMAEESRVVMEGASAADREGSNRGAREERRDPQERGCEGAKEEQVGDLIMGIVEKAQQIGSHGSPPRRIRRWGRRSLKTAVEGHRSVGRLADDGVELRLTEMEDSLVAAQVQQQSLLSKCDLLTQRGLPMGTHLKLWLENHLPLLGGETIRGADSQRGQATTSSCAGQTDCKTSGFAIAGTLETGWQLTDDWVPCPVGMIPSAHSLLGQLPCLDRPVSDYSKDTFNGHTERHLGYSDALPALLPAPAAADRAHGNLALPPTPQFGIASMEVMPGFRQAKLEQRNTGGEFQQGVTVTGGDHLHGLAQVGMGSRLGKRSKICEVEDSYDRLDGGTSLPRCDSGFAEEIWMETTGPRKDGHELAEEFRKASQGALENMDTMRKRQTKEPEVGDAAMGITEVEIREQGWTHHDIGLEEDQSQVSFEGCLFQGNQIVKLTQADILAIQSEIRVL